MMPAEKSPNPNTPDPSPHKDPAPDPYLGQADIDAQAQADVQAQADAEGAAALDLLDMRWLRSVQPILLELRTIVDGDLKECDPCRTAARESMIAICDRLGRIARRDVPIDQL
jgi:hypothetical protein